VLIRCVVLQLPIVQGLIYLVLLVVASETQSLNAAQYSVYAAPVMFVSIFTALWGMGKFRNIYFYCFDVYFLKELLYLFT
jgi:hypothetical protein